MQRSYPQLQQLSNHLHLATAPPCFRLITGEHDLHRKLLSSVLLHSPTNLSVFILDAGNVFEGLFLSRLAKVIGARARKVFQRMMISRTFTAYQTETALLSLRRTLAPNRTLFIGLHPLATFYDEQLPLADAERKIERIGRSLADARQMGFRLLFTLPPSDHHVGRAHFTRLLSRYAEEVISLSSIKHSSLTSQPYGTNSSILHAGY